MGKEKLLVIAIAAVSGGGKTSIIKDLNNMLENLKALFFDDYELDGPDDICDWVERSGDCNEWNLKPMINDLTLLRGDNSVKFILMDYPFAYLNEEMKRYLDFTIFIDTPLDIAMARRILRDFKSTTVELIQKDIKHYLDLGRNAYVYMLNTIKPNSDYVIDGLLPENIILSKIREKIFEGENYEN
jgi:uridine kinase